MVRTIHNRTMRRSKGVRTPAKRDDESILVGQTPAKREIESIGDGVDACQTGRCAAVSSTA